MEQRSEKRWVVWAALAWAALLAVAVVLAVSVQRRSIDVLDYVVTTDPSPQRKALVAKLRADRLVAQALLQVEQAATSGGLNSSGSGLFVPDPAVALLEEAERLYLESLDIQTSQPALLFHLAEVNYLLGRRSRADAFVARYWHVLGEEALAQVYKRRFGDGHHVSGRGTPGPKKSRSGGSHPLTQGGRR